MPKDTPFPRPLPTDALARAQGFDPSKPLKPETLQRIARAIKRFGIDRTPQPITINGVEYHVTDVSFRSITTGRA